MCVPMFEDLESACVHSQVYVKMGNPVPTQNVGFMAKINLNKLLLLTSLVEAMNYLTKEGGNNGFTNEIMK